MQLEGLTLSEISQMEEVTLDDLGVTGSKKAKPQGGTVLGWGRGGMGAVVPRAQTSSYRTSTFWGAPVAGLCCAPESC